MRLFAQKTLLLILLMASAALRAEELPSLAPIIAEVQPSVVNIATRGRVRMEENPLFQDPFFRYFFDIPNMPKERLTQSLGSGVIVDAEKGYILTNHHVVERADQIMVTFADNSRLEAKLVAADKESDIALVKIERKKKLKALPFGNSDNLKVGDFVIALGSPFGLGQTATLGIVSALGRSGLGIEGYEDFIQTDASINPGNSGGALVNTKGELVGINTAILAPSGGNIGIGFAIPINMASAVMDQLLRYGEVRRGMLGIYIQDLTPELAKAFHIEATTGAVVSQVMPDSPAEKSGIKAGDVIVAINGKPVRNAADLRNTIGLLPLGEQVTLDLLRNGKKLRVKATMSERQAAKAPAKTTNPKLAGATIAEMDPSSPLYGKIKGLLVVDVEPDTPAWLAGLRPGDVITSINRRPVESLENFQEIASGSDILLLNIRRGNAGLFIVIQ